MIQGAVMERDEKNRLHLHIHGVGGQTRLMKLRFTGLIAVPEMNCREWFAAINGYPPEPEVHMERYMSQRCRYPLLQSHTEQSRYLRHR
jgi:hypothetical protein